MTIDIDAARKSTAYSVDCNTGVVDSIDSVTGVVDATSCTTSIDIAHNGTANIVDVDVTWCIDVARNNNTVIIIVDVTCINAAHNNINIPRTGNATTRDDNTCNNNAADNTTTRNKNTSITIIVVTCIDVTREDTASYTPPVILNKDYMKETQSIRIQNKPIPTENQ